MSFDMNKMLREARRMQEELVKAQEEAATAADEAQAFVKRLLGKTGRARLVAAGFGVP